MSFIEHIKTLPQYLIPQHGLSQLAGRLASSTTLPGRHWFMSKFAAHYGIDMALAVESDFNHYESFNQFFTRAIKPERRPIDNEADTLACPADGAISQFGLIEQGQIVQAKNHDYSVADLLGDEELAPQFEGGQFCTIYLSPKDYHRFHMPCDGKLTRMLHVPGKLFSVNPLTARTVPRLFARNERVVALFDTAFGPVAAVAVGATIVGSIEMVWSGVVTPPSRMSVQSTDYTEQNIHLAKGEEMGRFLLGSTIILVLPKGNYQWDASIANEATTLMGQALVKRVD